MRVVRGVVLHRADVLHLLPSVNDTRRVRACSCKPPEAFENDVLLEVLLRSSSRRDFVGQGLRSQSAIHRRI